MQMNSQKLNATPTQTSTPQHLQNQTFVSFGHNLVLLHKLMIDEFLKQRGEFISRSKDGREEVFTFD